VLVLRIVESWDEWLTAVWEGRGGMGKKKKEKQRKRVSAEGVRIKWLLPTDVSISDSIDDSVGDTVRLSQFESIGHSVDKIVWKNSTSPHRCIFPNKLYRPPAIRSVYTDGHIPSVYTDYISDRVSPSVYTDRFWDEIIFVGNNYRQILRWNYFLR